MDAVEREELLAVMAETIDNHTGCCGGARVAAVLLELLLKPDLHTPSGLDALPAGTKVLDKDNDVWTKLVNGKWQLTGTREESAQPSEYLLDSYPPLRAASTGKPR